MTNKAVSTAMCGQMLVDAALNTILSANTYNVPERIKNNVEEHQDIVAIDLETRYSTK